MSSQPQINISDAAACKVAELITDEQDNSLQLRVYITGGGCSGFQYGFTFDKESNEDDYIIHKELPANQDNAKYLVQQITLLVDALSMQYLENADIDYSDDVHGARFIITNPNAKTTCGCGSSFSVE